MQAPKMTTLDLVFYHNYVKRRLYFFLNFEFTRHSHVRNRSFLKMYQLKKFSTDFNNLFLKETRIFSLQNYEEFLSKFHLGDFLQRFEIWARNSLCYENFSHIEF